MEASPWKNFMLRSAKISLHASVGDADAAEYNFEMFDSNADGVVTLKEFLDLADTLINM